MGKDIRKKPKRYINYGYCEQSRKRRYKTIPYGIKGVLTKGVASWDFWRIFYDNSQARQRAKQEIGEALIDMAIEDDWRDDE